MGLHWTMCLLYDDDVYVLFHHSVQAYIRFDEILGRICDSSLKLLVGKCKHFQREVSFLGNLVSEVDIRTDLEKFRAVK